MVAFYWTCLLLADVLQYSRFVHFFAGCKCSGWSTFDRPVGILIFLFSCTVLYVFKEKRALDRRIRRILPDPHAGDKNRVPLLNRKMVKLQNGKIFYDLTILGFCHFTSFPRNNAGNRKRTGFRRSRCSQPGDKARRQGKGRFFYPENQCLHRSEEAGRRFAWMRRPF